MFCSKLARLLFLRTSSIPSRDSFFFVLLISLKRSQRSRASLASMRAICEGSSGFLNKVFKEEEENILWDKADCLSATDNVPHTVRANDHEDIVDIDVPDLDFGVTRYSHLVPVKITECASDCEPWAVLISPNTPRSLRFLVSLDSSSCLDNTLLLYLSVRLVIGRQLECANLCTSLLRMGQLTRSAEDSARVTDVCHIETTLDLEHCYTAGTTCPIVLLYFYMVSTLRGLPDFSWNDSNSCYKC